MARLAHMRATVACGCLFWGFIQSAQATDLTVRGVIVAPASCVINGGSTLSVPFGNTLLTNRVDGINYRRDVPYTVVCTGAPDKAMKLELQGAVAAFDLRSLATNNSNLGIKMFINGAAWPLNTTVNFTYPTLPKMEAVPIRKPGSELKAGSFSASATLVVKLP